MKKLARKRGRYTLVTSAHVSNNPRLVKEADALFAAGHAVRVVAMDVEAEARARDLLVMQTRRWELDVVSAGATTGWIGRFRWARSAGSQRFAALMVHRGRRGRSWVDRAYSRYHRELASVASRQPADVVVAHNLEALPAAARAARSLGARLAFDIEDFHSGDVPDRLRRRAYVETLVDVERHYLPLCDALLASSDGIADEVVRVYGVRRPTVVLNAFRVADRAPAPASALGARRAVPSLYWYSQTIGPGRGLEDAVRALASSGAAAHLYLRGRASEPYRRVLEDLARSCGVGERLHLLEPAPPDDMVALAAEHDIGLALEQPDTRNRQICVTNKILTYLAAGIAVVATDTEGQRGVMIGAPGAGRLVPPGDPGALGGALASLLATPAALQVAREAAQRAAASRFSWEREEAVLVAALENAATRRSAAHAGASISASAMTSSPS